MKKSKLMTKAMILGGMGVAGYMYMKKNPETMYNVKSMIRSAAKKTYEKMDDVA